MSELESGSAPVPAQEAPAAPAVESNWPPPAEMGGPEVDATVQEEQAPQEQRTVPLAALHEERNRRKEAAARAAQLEADFRALQAQQVQMMQYMQSVQQGPAPPSFQEDPLAAIGYGVQAINQEVQTLKAKTAAEEYQRAQVAGMQNFAAHVDRQEKAFQQQHPDYLEAVNWAKARKHSEYVAGGLTEQEATARLTGEVWQLAQLATQRGESPAEVAYRMAQAMGYQPKASSAQQKLDMQKAGVAAATPSGGGNSGVRSSLDALLKMDSKDFLKATEGDNWRKFASKLSG